MPTTRGCAASAASSSTVVAAWSAASCGWAPTEHQTSAWRSAIARIPGNWSSLVPIVSIVATPAARARARTASRSPAKSGKSRWQWLSTSIVPAPLASGARRLGLDKAREDAARRRQRPARRQLLRQIGKAPRLRRHRQLVEQHRRCGGHERLRQDAEVPERLGERVEHGAHARRVAAPERPGRLLVDIAVGLANDAPDRLEREVERLLPDQWPDPA